MLDTAIGIMHFLTDRTPSNLRSVPPKPPRENAWRRGGKPLVSRARAGEDIRHTLEYCVEALGGLAPLHLRGKRVFLKPNFNSPDPFPGHTDLAFLRAATEMLMDAGARVTVGDSSGGMWRPTRNTFAKTGALDLARSLGVELIAFDDRPADWVQVGIPGNHLKMVTVPRSAYEAEVMVYLPCMKVHRQARFSLSLKLGVGFMHPGERRALHTSNVEEKAAELNLVWQPDLILLDGRKAFVTRGPDKGQVVEPGVVLASGDLVAVDLEALSILQSYPAENRLDSDPLDLPQIATALSHGLGEFDYVSVDGGKEAGTL